MRTRWVRIALLTWIAAAACARGAVHAETGAARDGCRPADGYVSAAQQAHPADGDVVVPIAIHLMSTDVSPPPGWPAPQDAWQPAVLENFFGSPSTAGLVNDLVWRRGGIRVAVVKVETCAYSSAAFRQGGDQRKASVPNPDEGREAAELYHRINAAYNAYDERASRALDVYLWVKVGERSLASAYGTSLKRQTAAVWADGFCAVAELVRPETCALKLAHEIAHALTLPHVCKNTGIGPNHPDAGIAVACGAAAESPESRVNLMRAVKQGRNLTPEQMAQARAWARQHYGAPRSD